MTATKATCADVPQFDRLRYFYGQLLHARDLQLEQAYFREKLKLHNRCLHGSGVVCGLEVAPPGLDPDCRPVTDVEYAKVRADIAEKQKLRDATGDPQRWRELDAELETLRRQRDGMPAPTDCAPPDPRTRVEIACGLAIDCEGNELVVREPMLVDLWSALSGEDRRQIESGATTTLYLALCYRECPIDPVRPVVPDACGATSECNYGKLRDAVSIVVTTDGERWTDERCEPCCTPCPECCVLLARIDGFVKGRPLTPEQVHPEMRRPLSLRRATTITGINWVHDGRYTAQQAIGLLGSRDSDTGGLEIRFSRPLRTDTITNGTVDVWVIEGGGGRSAGISNKAGRLILDDTPTIDRIIYRDQTGETLNNGDRVLIVVRAPFLLDDCCRPVDGAHAGGRVPLLPDSPPVTGVPARPSCATPPNGVPPWTSGAGAGAGNFESWFWICRPTQGEIR